MKLTGVEIGNMLEEHEQKVKDLEKELDSAKKDLGKLCSSLKDQYLDKARRLAIANNKMLYCLPKRIYKEGIEFSMYVPGKYSIRTIPWKELV